MTNRFAGFALALAVLVAPLGAQARQDTLYKRLGGYDAIAAVTDDFIGRVVADPQLGKFFKTHSADSNKRTRQLAVDMICMATGGPCVYIGRDLKTAHAGLGITESDWNTAVRLLTESLYKFKVPQAEKDEFLGIVSSLKKDVVEKM